MRPRTESAHPLDAQTLACGQGLGDFNVDTCDSPLETKYRAVDHY